MNSRLLLSCQKLGYRSTQMYSDNSEMSWEIYDLNWDLFAGQRVMTHFENEEQQQVLWRLLQKKLKPKSGSIQTMKNAYLHSDESLWKGLNLRASIQENLESKLFLERPWFGNKRLNRETLMDRLNLSGRMLHLPVSELDQNQKKHFWILMLVTAKTKIVLLNQVLENLDSCSISFLCDWLKDFSGAVVAFHQLPFELQKIFITNIDIRGK